MTHQIQNLIKQAKREWESTVDSLPQLICLLDEEGNIRRANMTVERWNLLPVNEVKDKNLHTLLHPNCVNPNCYLTTFWPQAKANLQQGQPIEGEWDDEILQRSFHWKIRPINMQTDTTAKNDVGFAVTIEDVTQKNHTEKMLKLTQFTVDRAAEAVFWVRIDGTIFYVNETACSFLGYSRNELLSLTISDIDSNYPLEIWPTHCRSTKERGPITVESRHRAKDGELKIVEVTFNYIEFNGAEYNCVFVRDISWRAWSARALQQSYAELQIQNDELTAFAHTVAHNLKSPLGIIVGYADLLEIMNVKGQDISTNTWLKYMKKIAKTGRKMGNIVDEMLLLSEMQAQNIELAPLDMHHIIHQVHTRLSQIIESCQVRVDLPDNWPVALGHAFWVEEVWVNYISNALKYGGCPPHLQLGATQQADGMIRFWVQDNGPGLKPDEQLQLFTPFTQLAQPDPQSNGLGLSIVKRIIEKLGGEVGVDSKGIPGQGCKFFFTLPAENRLKTAR